MFPATRRREIIDILHALVLCVSYERILRITQGLGIALLQIFHDDNAVIPGILRTGLFAVAAKYNKFHYRLVELSCNKYVIIPISIEL